MKVSLCNIKNWFARGSGCLPVGLQVLGDVLASLLQLELVEHDVEVFRLAELQLVRPRQLDVHVARLGGASRFDQPAK